MPNPRPQLLIAGASARAAAQSAAKAGLLAASADRFADQDLAEVAQATRLIDWPEGLVSWSAEFPAEIPFVYLGGLENHPALLAAIGRRHPVAGITGSLLATLRNPQSLAKLAAKIGMRTPRSIPEGTREAGRTLIKPFDSIAGLGIRLENEDETTTRLAPGEYRQEFLAGTPLSAAYLMADAGCELIGTARQLVRDDSPAAPAFQYAGALTITPPCPEPLNRLGSLLHVQGVRGLCGADFILTEENEPILLEINPRWTASMELFERQSGRSLLAEHLAAFGHPPTTSRPCCPPSLGCWGKKILFAKRSVRWAPTGRQGLELLFDDSIQLADVPHAGQRIAPGEPVCTLLARASSESDCLERLLTAEGRLDRAMTATSTDDDVIA